jgi:hypothetical protein
MHRSTPRQWARQLPAGQRSALRLKVMDQYRAFSLEDVTIELNDTKASMLEEETQTGDL